MYNRLISLPNDNSFFLFGQRGVGKSSLIDTRFRSEALVINLLDSKTYLNLATTPWKLREVVAARNESQQLIVIDEVQKIPALLDEVHLLIEEQKINFALTGSSARKLKRAGVNLLAGRAFHYRLYPLTYKELANDFDLDEILQWGSLPKTITEHAENLREEYLHSYVTTYLQQEIIIEQLVRNIEPFNRFLEIAAQSNTNIINYDNIAKDVKVSAVSIKSYFEILEDTLIGFTLPAYHTSIRKRQKAAPKFYFHDIGLVRTLQKQLLIKPLPSTFEYGILFESFVVNEIVRLNEYYRTRYAFSHLRVDNNTEIDLIIERPGKETVLVEIKSKDHIDARDTVKLNGFVADFKNAKAYCLSRDSTRRKIDNVLCLSWNDGIDEIFEGKA